MKIIFVMADSPREYNTSFWLAHLPAAVLKRHGVEAEVWNRDQFACAINSPGLSKKLSETDVIIAERICFGNYRRAISYWAQRVATIYRWDDHYAAMPEYYKMGHDFWRKNEIMTAVPQLQQGVHISPTTTPTPVLAQMREVIENARAISSPSRYLLEYYGKAVHSSKRIYIPNRHDAQWAVWQQPALYQHPGEIWIGWGGSYAHLESWQYSGIIPALREITASREDVRIAIAGHAPHIIAAIRDGGIPPQVIHSLPFVKHDMWPRVVKSFDIGVAPLAGEYDKGRSWIKCLEYAQCGVPWAASDHQGVYDGCRGGYTVNNTAEGWRQALHEMVVDQGLWVPDPYATAWAENESLDHHVDEYKELANL